jgi:hypothetical protein
VSVVSWNFSAAGNPNAGLTGGWNVTANGNFSTTVVVPASTDNLLILGIATGVSTLTLSNLSVRQILGNHATQATATARPILQAAPNRLVFQADDSLVTTFPAALGADCTVARGVAGGDPVILTGQNIGTTYTLGLAEMSVTGLVIVNGPLNPVQTSRLARYLKALG